MHVPECLCQVLAGNNIFVLQLVQQRRAESPGCATVTATESLSQQAHDSGSLSHTDNVAVLGEDLLELPAQPQATIGNQWCKTWQSQLHLSVFCCRWIPKVGQEMANLL